MAKMKIGDLFKLEKGSLQSSKCIAGQYDFITASKEWKTHNEFSHDTEALIFAAMASGSLGRTHYLNGKFITSDLCYILTPKDSEKYPINLKFYHFVFNSLRDEIVKNTKSGTSKESINQTNLKKYEIPYFDIEQQNIWIDRLLKTKSIKENLISEIETQEELLKKLRQSILQEAIEGKLTASWREQNPDIERASVLLEKIKIEKEQLIKEKKIKKQKPLPPINENEIPFEITDSWEWCRLGEIANGFQYGTSSKSLKDGLIPVLRMGNIQNGLVIMSDFVYTNNQKDLEKYNLSYNDILFNRTNSRELVGKTAIYTSNKKVIYAGYLVRITIIGGISPKYINFLMNSDLHRNWCNEVKTDAIGQSNINATKLKSYRVPLPPIEEQKEIVKKIENLFGICDELETQIKSSKKNSQTLMQAVLKEAFKK